MSPDPIGYAGGTINLYAYVGNNPISMSDASGMGPGGFGSAPSGWACKGYSRSGKGWGASQAEMAPPGSEGANPAPPAGPAGFSTITPGEFGGLFPVLSGTTALGGRAGVTAVVPFAEAIAPAYPGAAAAILVAGFVAGAAIADVAAYSAYIAAVEAGLQAPAAPGP